MDTNTLLALPAEIEWIDARGNAFTAAELNVLSDEVYYKLVATACCPYGDCGIRVFSIHVQFVVAVIKPKRVVGACPECQRPFYIDFDKLLLC